MQVGLGTDDDTGNLVHSAKIDDLVVHDLHHVERLLGRDRVDENIAMDANGMLGVEDRVLVLQRRERSDDHMGGE